MKGRLWSEYRTRQVTNDTFVVTLEDMSGEPYPVDDMKFERRGDVIFVNGGKGDEGRAEAVAKQAFEKSYGKIDWQ
jgi:hypothetical protein